MSWQKGTNYFGVDVDAIGDGKPASAHLLRLLSRNANHLGGSPRNLLTVAACSYNGIPGETAFSVVLKPETWVVLSEWPVFKPANVEYATLYIDGGVSDVATVYYEVTTSRGTYVVETVGDLSPSIPVLLRRGRTDFLKIRARCEGGELSPSGYGSPSSGSADTLRFLVGGVWEIDSSVGTRDWDVAAPNYASTGHVIQFHIGSDVILGTYAITFVEAVDQFGIESSIPLITDASGYIRPGWPNAAWRVRLPAMLSLSGISLISDEVSP